MLILLPVQVKNLKCFRCKICFYLITKATFVESTGSSMLVIGRVTILHIHLSQYANIGKLNKQIYLLRIGF